MLILAVTGCPGGNGSIGDPCDGLDGCASTLQCVANVCVPRCQRAPECGDGHACSGDGLCVLATGQAGDACRSEVECAPGLSCQLDGIDSDGAARSSCAPELEGRPAGARCAADDDCRNGTCALGHCVDLCAVTRDCGAGTTCMSIPRVRTEDGVQTGGEMFSGCLSARGPVTWSIPVNGPSDDILLPVPDAARSATVVFRVDDRAQAVGAVQVRAPSDPSGSPSYIKPCMPKSASDPTCPQVAALDQYYRQPIRHMPATGQSVLQMPSGTSSQLEPGAYRIKVSSFRPNGDTGSAIPRVTAVVKMDSAVNLDLHFHFLDLEDHPCESAFGGTRLDAARAQTATFFQTGFLGELLTIFSSGGIALGAASYVDVKDHPDLDALPIEDAGALLSLGSHAVGINVFFVRTLSPAGLQAFGPNPGPAGIANTPQSGIVIALDTLCYRSWKTLARLTAHELARYMGLYHNVELEVGQHPTWRDRIDDSDDSSANLMFFSELGGLELSPGQRDILTKSGVLR